MFTLAIVFQTLSFIIYATSQDIGHYFVRAPPPPFCCLLYIFDPLTAA